MYEWLNLEESEQVSFVMYGSYEEQMQFLSNEQLGMVIRNAMHYVRTGEQKTEEPIVDMMVSVMANDIRNQKRNQIKRSAAGSAGGNASVKAKEKKKAAQEAAGTRESAKKGTNKTAKKTAKKQEPELGEELCEESLNDAERFSTNINHYVDEDMDVDVEMDMDVEMDADAYDTDSRLLRPAGADAGEREMKDSDELIRFGENQYLTTKGVAAQMKSLAKELLHRYWKTTPSDNDVENVFLKCYTLDYLPDGEHYAVFSPQRADMLRHVFKQAAEQGASNWRYIEGIYDNYKERGVETLDEAIENEYRWARGEI